MLKFLIDFFKRVDSFLGNLVDSRFRDVVSFMSVSLVYLKGVFMWLIRLD